MVRGRNMWDHTLLPLILTFSLREKGPIIAPAQLVPNSIAPHRERGKAESDTRSPLPRSPR